jgi:ubiquitin-conjugating enzyme E2 J1
MLEKEPGVVCQPTDDTLREFHFTFRGAEGSPFEDGYYHGRIVLPHNYPYGPPTIRFFTESGRFRTY